MAVYTDVSAEAMAALLARYDVGDLVSAKGIAEGVENSNYLVDTTCARFILTLYEKRVEAGDLPFFLALLDHLAERGCPVPPAVTDRDGVQIQNVAGRPACLIHFLPGVSSSDPSLIQCRSVGTALGKLHLAAADFGQTRANALGQAAWRPLAARCGDLDAVLPGLAEIVARELDFLDAHWPRELPQSVIHADLFPDNVLMRGDYVTGLIDFYFACTDLRAYDLAVTHSAWCFDSEARFDRDRAAALVEGYAAAGLLSDAERAALPILVRGAALRFLLTRAFDWVNTPPGALVRRKDPRPYLDRLGQYRELSAADICGG